MFTEEFCSYAKSVAEIQAEYNLSDKQWKEMSPPYYTERAKRMIAKFSNQQIKSSIPPIIKIGITKLTLLHFLAKMQIPKDASDLISLENIENNSIKAHMFSDTLWGDIANEEASEITPQWYVLMEASSLADMLSMSNALRAKILLRENVDEVKLYTHWEAHVVMCRELNIDPKQYSEVEATDMLDTLHKYKDITDDIK